MINFWLINISGAQNASTQVSTLLTRIIKVENNRLSADSCINVQNSVKPASNLLKFTIGPDRASLTRQAFHLIDFRSFRVTRFYEKCCSDLGVIGGKLVD